MDEGHFQSVWHDEGRLLSVTAPTILDAAWPMGRGLIDGSAYLFLRCPNAKTPGRNRSGRLRLSVA
ncbi:hypothetical protein [Nocardia amikacinitolerans]|uniref:hypothetical protein n=1 Tax=Nocardia amikacinitolerans TaxID=756689 RepID=UPI0012EE46ED|nr:hypothetical protein [Nocardia amikacinitolerans]